MEIKEEESSVEPKIHNVYTREEVSQHNTKSDCWTIVHGKVYDVTNYLVKHPGGVSLLFKNAGGDSTSDFEGMFHSSKARKILAELEIGSLKGQVVASRALSAHRHRIPKIFEAGELNQGKSSSKHDSSSVENNLTTGFVPSMHTLESIKEKEITNMMPPPPKGKSGFLKARTGTEKGISRRTVTLFELIEISILNHNTKIFRFKTEKQLNLPAGYHITVVQNNKGKISKRDYTPIADKKSYFELLVKVYNTGKMSEHIHAMKVKDTLGMLGPFGHWEYKPGHCKKLIMLAAGTGITPMYQVLHVITANPTDTTTVSLLYANKDVRDILLKKKLDTWNNPGTIDVHYILSQPKNPTDFLTGHISEEIIKNTINPNPANSDEFVLICGPDGFCNLACTILDNLLYPKERLYKF